MPITPDIWFGTNDIIYSQNYRENGSISSGQTHVLDFGLSDMAELPGQSTIYVNKLKFTVRGFVTGNGYQSGSWVAGIVPRDAVGIGYETVKDFQDYMAWPLKGMVGYNLTQGVGPTGDQGNRGNHFSFTMTYRPRKALLINREQNIILTYVSLGGPDIVSQLSCCGEFKRAN